MHSINGFQKPIDRYTNQVNVNKTTSTETNKNAYYIQGVPQTLIHFSTVNNSVTNTRPTEFLIFYCYNIKFS